MSKSKRIRKNSLPNLMSLPLRLKIFAMKTPSISNWRTTLIRLLYSENRFTVFYLDLSTNNSPITWKRSESDADLSSNFGWEITHSDGSYQISHKRNGITYYLKSDSSSNNAALTYTTNANDSGTKWLFHNYGDQNNNSCNAIDNIEWDFSSSTLLPGESFTYSAHMYSTQIGVNGPVVYSVENIDGSATDKATINSSTGVFQALKPGKVKVRIFYSGAPCLWYNIITITDTVVVSCYNEEGFWDVSNSATTQYVECNDFDDLTRCTWLFEHQNNDCFTIKNLITGYYLKNIDNQLVHVEHNLSTLPDNMLWRLQHQEDDYFKIQSKSNGNYFITEEDVSHSWQDPDILLSNENAGQRQLWKISPRLYSQITLENQSFISTSSLHNNIASYYGQHSHVKGACFSSISTSELISKFQISSFTCIITHGGTDEDKLKTSTGALYLSDLSSLSSENFAGVQLIVLSCCYSGRTNGFVDYFQNKGVDVVIGFDDAVEEHVTVYWTQQFIRYITLRNSVSQAISLANTDMLNEFGSTIYSSVAYELINALVVYGGQTTIFD